MSLFSQRHPRAFNLPRRQAGHSRQPQQSSFAGTFQAATTHLSRRQRRRLAGKRQLTIPMLLLLITVLALVWWILTH